MKRFTSVRSMLSLLTLLLVTVVFCSSGQSYGSSDKDASSRSVFGSSTKNPFVFKGAVYKIPPNTNRLPDFSSLKPVGHIYNHVLNIPPQRFDKGFPGVTDRFEWFAIDYKARVYIPSSKEYTFSLLSDDGSRLIIDGKTVIDNDGIHPPREKIGKIFLEKGIHSFEVQYFQGPRFYVALVFSLINGKNKQLFDIKKFSPVQVEEAGCRTKLTLGSAILFDFNSYLLKPQSMAVLDSVVDFLKSNKYRRIIVAGHTDNIGSESYNDRLSRLRAKAVASYLLAKSIPPEKIKVVGYGERRPKVPNDTEAHRAQNRRVEIIVEKECHSKAN